MAHRRLFCKELNLERDFGADFTEQWKLFEVSTKATSKQEYLLRPDLGRIRYSCLLVACVETSKSFHCSVKSAPKSRSRLSSLQNNRRGAISVISVHSTITTRSRTTNCLLPARAASGRARTSSFRIQRRFLSTSHSGYRPTPATELTQYPC